MMSVRRTIAILLSATALVSFPVGAFAQTGEAAAAPSSEDSAAQIEFMQAQIEAMQKQLDELKKTAKTNTPNWKGAPEFANDSGFRFKPKGLVQFDAGYVSNPNDALASKSLGFNSRSRRLVLGAEGTVPGGFGYNVEFNFANGQVDFEDVVLTYQRDKSPLRLTIGNFYPLSSLETMTSSRVTSFLERDQFTDAFGYNRRLGVALAYIDPQDTYSITAGLFTKSIDNTYTNDGWQGSVRATYSPQVGNGRLHLGANYQHREASTDALNVRYRARPFTQVTDFRFVDTGAIAAKGDDTFGLELGGIFGPFHFAGEGQYVKVSGYRPGTTFANGDTVAGGAFFDEDPSFTAGYAEVGYFLTGESRGYKGGRWDRTKVAMPFDKGGWGAWQIVGRFSHLDLADRVAGATYAAPSYVAGGKQDGYLFGVNWFPMDYLRLSAQYARSQVKGGPQAATVNGVPAGAAAQGSDYGVDTFAVRAQLDF